MGKHTDAIRKELRYFGVSLNGAPESIGPAIAKALDAIDRERAEMVEALERIANMPLSHSFCSDNLMQTTARAILSKAKD